MNQKDSKEVNESDTKPEGDNVIVLPRSKRWLLFSLFVILNILMNIDHGTIPAATSQIRADLEINDAILGVFGSIVYGGTIIGSFLSLALINLLSRKYLMIGSICLCSVCLFLFIIKQHYALLFLNRGVVGIFQSFISIYFPVWCDQFGVENKKTMMIALVQICSPLGVVLGYFMTTLFSNGQGWKATFVVQSISLVALSMTMLFFPEDYFKSSLRKNYKLSTLKKSYFFDESLLETTDSNNEEKTEEKGLSIILRQFKQVFTEPIFIFSVLSMASLFYIVTCIQYWASDYMIDTLGVDDENLRLICFAVISLTAPVLGVIIGSLVISWIGGYESKHSSLLCFGFCVMAFIFAIPAPLVKTLLHFAIMLWIILFFGGAIIAPLNGIIITALPKEYAGSANAISLFFCNLIGKLPAPYIYGTVKMHVSGRVAMMISLWIAIIAVIFLALTTFFRYRNYDKIKEYAISSPSPNSNDNNSPVKIDEEDKEIGRPPIEET